MSDTLQNSPPDSAGRKVVLTCGAFTLVAILSLSLAAIAAAALVLLGVLP